jgi:DNA ligase (NAD+)
MARPSASVRREIDELRREIDEHNHRYHRLDAPTITDAEFDELFRRLLALERQHPELVTPDSPTQRVGATPASGFETVVHRQQMLSLQNAMTREELADFDARIRRFLGKDAIVYAGEPKMDGVAVELVYEDGALTIGSTRGDGSPARTSRRTSGL